MRENEYSYENCMKRAREMGCRFNRQSHSNIYDVISKDGTWLCFDTEIDIYFKKLDGAAE